MFGSTTPKIAPTPHRKLEVETTDSEIEFEFEEGGVEVSFTFVEDTLVVTKSDRLKAIFPTLNVIRVEEFIE